MYRVFMRNVSGACCLTGEMCSFAVLELEFTERNIRDTTYNSVGAVLGNHYSQRGDGFYGWGETPTDAWLKCLEAVQAGVNCYSYVGQQCRYFWFVDYQDGDGYQNDELREIVKNLPNVVKLGEYENANSANLVDGYMVPFVNANGQVREDEDDEY